MLEFVPITSCPLLVEGLHLLGQRGFPHLLKPGTHVPTQKLSATSDLELFFGACPQYQYLWVEVRGLSRLSREYAPGFQERAENTVLKTTCADQLPRQGLDTCTVRKTSLVSRKRSKQKLSSRTVHMYVPSPMKGYSIPSLTPGSISTSSVRSSFTSLQRGRASKHEVFNSRWQHLLISMG